MELLDTLTSKSTEELKRYLTDEGYKDEAVELAINILRERGVNIDNELRDRQVAFCSQCKKQKFNPKEGIICALTGQKATFGTNCKDFDQNGETPAKAQHALRRERKLRAEQVYNLGEMKRFFITRQKTTRDRGEPTERLDLLIQLLEEVQLFYLHWFLQHKSADSSFFNTKNHKSKK